MKKSFNLKSQRGAVLAFCLLMLLLLTLAGTRMIQQNKQQLEIAGNTRLLTQEFANAEGLLAEAKNVINDNPAHVDSSGTAINNSAHQCEPTADFKQNILLAGVTIMSVRCKSDDGTEQVCSSYDGVKTVCKDTTIACNTISDAIAQFNAPTDICYQDYDPQCNEDLSTTNNPRCKNVTPTPDDTNKTCSDNFIYKEATQAEPSKCIYPPPSCPKEIYTIQVISTNLNGTTRQIVSDHVVGCGS